VSFRQFIRKGYQGERATLADFELHLTTLFPDVRLKQYLEVRCVDAQPPARIPAVAAFWKGLIYSKTSRAAVARLFKKVSEEQLQEAYANLPRQGLQTQLGRHRLLDWAREVVQLAAQGLTEQTTAFEDRNESVFLKPLLQDLKKGTSPADLFLAEFEKRKRQNRFWTLNRLRI
jgi:glutamate--cysteine ligase